LSNSPLTGFKPPLLHEQRFKVEFEYPVVFCRGALAASEPTLAWSISRREPERRHPVYVVLDGGLVAARPSLSAEVEAYVAPGYAGKRWDACATDALVTAAGGILTDTHGDPIDYRAPSLSNSRGLLASNGRVHEALVRGFEELR
jgi:hypothetical protein